MAKQKKQTAKKKTPEKKTAARKQPADPFARLTWDDVESWAGATILSRGQGYQRSGAVRELARTPDGELIAWVLGTERYVTRVSISGRTQLKLASECTCPYWTTCKHAVAVVLVYLEKLKAEESVPQVAENDSRLKLLAEWAEEFDDFDEDDEFDDYDEDEDEEAPPSRGPRAPSKKSSSVRPYLRKYTKEELLSLLDEVADEYPEFRQRLEDQQTLQSGQTRKMIQAVRQEISSLGEMDMDWESHGYGSHSADLDRLEQHLKALIEAGQADALVQLGRELLTAGGRAVEQEDEGESSYELSECLTLIFQALPQSSLSPADQLEWAMDMSLADEYSLCEEGLMKFWEIEFDKAAWSELADRMQQQLENFDPVSSFRDEFSHRYHRDRLSNRLIGVLQNAGRSDAIIPLCEREAPITHSYQRLVERLIAAKRWKEAESWCLKGLEDNDTNRAGTTRNLREQLRTISAKTGDKLRAAAFVADKFFSSPGLSTFLELCRTAREAKVGEAVETWARHYLVTGNRPQPAGSRKGRRRKDDPALDWPLPASGAPEENPRWVQVPQPPMVRPLIEIAIHEEKPDEVLKWYDYPGRGEGRRQTGYGYASESVAEAIQDAYPDRAIEIWKAIAEGYIAQTQPKAYQTAGTYLRQMRDLMIKKRRKGEWETYLKELREKNRRKPRCVEVLDRLASSTKRIVDG